MSDDETRITLDIPGRIDGDPFDVERTILAQLPPLLDSVAEYLDDASRQLANTERSRILAEETGIGAADLAERYAETTRAGALVRMTGAAKAMCRAAADLEKR